MKILSCFLVFAAVSSCAVRAELWLSNIFSDHAVLQRDQRIHVWGRGAEGAVVSVSIGEASENTTVVGGKWSLELPSMSASGPHVLTVSSRGKTKTFNDVMIGEVFCMAGQSNMRWQLARTSSARARKAMTESRDMDIRQFAYGYESSDVPLDEPVNGAWLLPDENAIGMFSTLGLYFAEALQRLGADVPIGLIESAVGGTHLHSWFAQDYFVKTAELDAYFSDAFREGEFVKPEDAKRPFGYYHGRVAPIQKYSIRGILWYQGESSSDRRLASHHRDQYAFAFQHLVRSWRLAWGREDMPFFCVQLPSFETQNYDYVTLRNQQQRAVTEIENAGLVISLDSGDRKDIHPPDKEVVAERLATMVSNFIEGKAWTAQSPTLHLWKVAKNRVFLKFKIPDQGDTLRNASVGKAEIIEITKRRNQQKLDLQGFEIADPSGKFVRANARIHDVDTISLSAKGVDTPAQVRYLWKNYAKDEVSLYSSSGYPVGPFRIDCEE